MVAIINQYVPLTRNGANWKGKCPFHSDKTASLVVSPSKNMFKCFGCGKSGDVIAFVMATGKTFKESIAELQNPNNIQALPLQAEAKPKWTPIRFDTMPSPHHHKLGIPSKIWRYDDYGLICRFDTPEGKEVLPYVYATNGQHTMWRWMGFNKPRPLYNLSKILSTSNEIIITEGEKCADKVSELLPMYTSTTWIGGAQAILATNWKPLFGRSVLLWPDNDAVGYEAINKIAEILKPNCNIRFIKNPVGSPEHWDIADSDWSSQFASYWIVNNS